MHHQGRLICVVILRGGGVLQSPSESSKTTFWGRWVIGYPKQHQGKGGVLTDVPYHCIFSHLHADGRSSACHSSSHCHMWCYWRQPSCVSRQKFTQGIWPVMEMYKWAWSLSLTNSWWKISCCWTSPEEMLSFKIAPPPVETSFNWSWLLLRVVGRKSSQIT